MKWMKKHKIWTAVIAVLLLIGFVGALTDGGTDTKNDTKKSEPQVTYTLDAESKAVDTKTLEVNGTTNIPNGSMLGVVVERISVAKGESEERFFRVATTTATVKDGKYDVQTSVDDQKFLAFEKASGPVESVDGNVQVTVTFDPQAENQPQAVIDAVGKSGEKLESSPQKKVFGSLTKTPVNQLEVMLKTVLAFPYTDQLPR